MSNYPHLHPLRVLGRAEFALRAFGFASAALGFIVLSLGIGVLGYRVFAGLGWVDALLNAAMILTGMGPVNPLPDDTAKVFAAAYAIYSSLAFTSISAILLYPFVQRMLQILHFGKDAGTSAPSTPTSPPDAP